MIGGPTASGKSVLALRLAQALAAKGQLGVVLNADALQLYRDLRIITARPSAEEEALAPHRLYGVLDGAERSSVAAWLDLAREEIEAVLATNGVPIVVGGSGMYLHALTHGLSAIPEIDPDIRRQAVLLHTQLGGVAFREKLALADPHGAALLHAGDTQRLIRAYEVVASTGRPLRDWQAEPIAQPPTHWKFHTFVVEPARALLYSRCDRRFDLMLAQGAMDEVAQLAARGLAPDLPVMKAVGVPELMAVARGELTMEKARVQAQQATRNYAKRQLTWFRHQLPQALRLAPNSAEDDGKIGDFVADICNILGAKR